MSSIGPFTVAKMDPQPQTAGTRLQPETKGGVDGVGFWDLGVAGHEFQLTTTVDLPTFAQAVLLEQLYRDLIGAGPQQITYGGRSIGYAVVMHVEARAERILYGQGGVSGQSTALCHATWRLIPV